MRHSARQTREPRTIPIDFQNEATYVPRLGAGKALLEWLLACGLSLDLPLHPKATCGGGGAAPVTRMRCAAGGVG